MVERKPSKGNKRVKIENMQLRTEIAGAHRSHRAVEGQEYESAGKRVEG